LNEALSDGYCEVRKDAAFALGRIGPRAKDAVPSLIRSLKDENKHVRREAVWALGAIGPSAKAAVPALTKAIDDTMGTYIGRELDINEVAIESLGKIGPGAVRAIPALIRRVREDGCHNSAASLAKIGPAALPALVRILKMEVPFVEVTDTVDERNADIAVREALGIELSTEEKKSVRSQKRKKRQRKRKKKHMERDWFSRIPHAQTCAVRALGLMGEPVAKQTVPILIQALDEEYLQTSACEALANIGCAAKKAIPLLKKLLQSEDDYTRKKAQEALKAIQG